MNILKLILHVVGSCIGAVALLAIILAATIMLFVFWPVGLVLWFIIIMGLNNQNRRRA